MPNLLIEEKQTQICQKHNNAKQHNAFLSNSIHCRPGKNKPAQQGNMADFVNYFAD
jgi:hypothetical protein